MEQTKTGNIQQRRSRETDQGLLVNLAILNMSGLNTSCLR